MHPQGQFDPADMLAAQGRGGEAVQLLQRRGRQGDAGALYKLAEWYRAGQFIPRDLAAARDLYGKAGAAGIRPAMAAHIALMSLGVGGPRDWQGALRLLRTLARQDPDAARQMRVIQAMELTEDGDPVRIPERQVLSEAPLIWTIPGLFTLTECNYLIQAATPLMARSQTIDQRTGQMFNNAIRTSDFAGFPWIGENPAIHALNRRLAAATGTRAEQGEPLQILRYRVGQQYRPHFDAVPGWDNQRIVTALVYLNEDYDGGETRFLDAGTTIRGQRGDLLAFRNVDEKGEPDASTMHEGCPVMRGEKLLASRWIRAQSLIV